MKLQAVHPDNLKFNSQERSLTPAFPQPVCMELLDGTACALLAAAASCRARSFGAPISGAVALGCLCGLLGPLLREIILHGQAGARLAVCELPDAALAGALGGILALRLFRGGFSQRLFFWLDSAGLALASSLGAVLAVPELGISGALVLGLANGMAPGMVRDMAIGDSAMLVEKDWYAAAAVTGCMLALSLLVLPAVFEGFPHLFGSQGELGVLLGALLTVCLRAWKGAVVE